MQNLEFLLGLLDEDEPRIGSDDLDGVHGVALRMWQEMGFLGCEPSANPVAGCPHCGEGVPYRLGERYICNACRSEVDARRLLLWPIDRDAFLRWLALQRRLRGEVRRIEDRLRQLGTWVDKVERHECFFRRSGELSTPGKTRLSAFRTTLLVCPLTPQEAGIARSFSLLEALRMDGPLEVSQASKLLRTKGTVRFDPHSGALWIGDARLGEVPPWE